MTKIQNNLHIQEIINVNFTDCGNLFLFTGKGERRKRIFPFDRIMIAQAINENL